MDSANDITFENKDDEIQYWKEKFHALYEELQAHKLEAEEFEGESKQLEKEYEIMLNQNEKMITELNIANSKAQLEIESLRAKLDCINKENNHLEIQVSNLSKEKIEQQNYIRKLEQNNDDLERARRIIEESIQGFESALNSAIERNAILESEVDEKETLKEKLQRLADETRDLKQELTVKEREKLPDNNKILNGFKSSIDSNKLRETETQTTPIKRDPKLLGPLSPASRVMAINLVGDLVRKIGSLERSIESSRCEYMEMHKKRAVSSTKNSSTPSIQSLSK
ncbi:hypothetical protein WA026_015419 [Henosepilachna vigintioctopunctata]|uniref:NUDE domain-containing protein n=1 Tax=Henosepilachna vigintioctopunctata TaxID=420089 RepID=A0AAW1UMR8_9CUCU